MGRPCCGQREPHLREPGLVESGLSAEHEGPHHWPQRQCNRVYDLHRPITDATRQTIMFSRGRNIVSSGIVLKRAKLIPNPLGPPMICTGTGSTPQNCVSDVPGAGQVNWNQVQTFTPAHLSWIDRCRAVFKCALDKQCTIQATDQNLKTAYVTSWSLDSSSRLTATSHSGRLRGQPWHQAGWHAIHQYSGLGSWVLPQPRR